VVAAWLLRSCRASAAPCQSTPSASLASAGPGLADLPLDASADGAGTAARASASASALAGSSTAEFAVLRRRIGRDEPAAIRGVSLAALAGRPTGHHQRAARGGSRSARRRSQVRGEVVDSRGDQGGQRVPSRRLDGVERQRDQPGRSFSAMMRSTAAVILFVTVLPVTGRRPAMIAWSAAA
jgi:hypothetical protein